MNNNKLDNFWTIPTESLMPNLNAFVLYELYT